MPYVKRANVVLEVKEDDLQYYTELGYNVIDENGNVIISAIPTSLGELRKFYVDATEKIKKLEARIAELENKKVKEPEVVNTIVEETTEVEAPKKRGRRTLVEAEKE